MNQFYWIKSLTARKLPLQIRKKEKKEWIHKEEWINKEEWNNKSHNIPSNSTGHYVF